MGGEVGRSIDRYWRNQSIGANTFQLKIGETNTFQLNFVSSIKIVTATGLGVLWALEWACKIFFGSIDKDQSIGIHETKNISVKIYYPHSFVWFEA